MKSLPIKIAIASLLLLLLSLSLVTSQVRQVVSAPLAITTDAELVIEKGQHLSKMLNHLEAKDWITSARLAKLYFKFFPSYADIKTGTYEVLTKDSLLTLLARVNAGKEKQYSINLVEGLTWRQWLSQMQAHPALLDDSADTDFELTLAGQSYALIEGLLLPDTYFFTKDTYISDLVMRANIAMNQFVAEAWSSRALDLPYNNHYDALIMASIVEKETGQASERAHIAGVFVNRLNINMRLQTDPTVIYGMGDSFDGDIRRADLRRKTPYNTYVIKGLPPTPIAMPSKAAILAALAPLETSDFYFVSRGDGSHKFSETLEQHNAAVLKYQLKK